MMPYVKVDPQTTLQNQKWDSLDLWEAFIKPATMLASRLRQSPKLLALILIKMVDLNLLRWFFQFQSYFNCHTTQMEEASIELGTAIILATDDYFRRKFRGEVSDRRKILVCQELLSNSNIAKLMLRLCPIATQKSKTQKQKFILQVRAALKNHPLYSVVTCAQQGKQERLEVIRRKCQFEKIQNKQLLIEYVFSKHKTGVCVDDELLNFSYPAISRDIEAAVRENMLLRMPLLGKSPQNCYLFPNLEKQSFRLATWEENDFQNQYLSLCKEFTQKDERVFEDRNNFEISLEVDEGDPNYKLDTFLELKKSWKIKETIKTLAQQEEARKIEIRERQEAEGRPIKK